MKRTTREAVFLRADNSSIPVAHEGAFVNAAPVANAHHFLARAREATEARVRLPLAIFRAMGPTHPPRRDVGDWAWSSAWDIVNECAPAVR